MQRAKGVRVRVFLFAVAVLGISTTGVHLRLTKSTPQQDATLTEAPDSIRLWFSEPVERALSAIRLEGPDGVVTVGDVVATEDPQSIKVYIEPQLRPGNYEVAWRAVGADGHPVRGRFPFVLGVSREDARPQFDR